MWKAYNMHHDIQKEQMLGQLFPADFAVTTVESTNLWNRICKGDRPDERIALRPQSESTE